VRDDEVGVFEEEAGFLVPEECINAFIHVAQNAVVPADTRYDEKVLSWREFEAETPRPEMKGPLICVNTDKGEYLCRSVIV
jgi:hypothetical protein